MQVPQPGTEDWRRQLMPNTLGSTDEPVVVRSESATVEFALTQDDEVRTRSGRPGPARLILRVDNIAISRRLPTIATLPAVEASFNQAFKHAFYVDGNVAAASTAFFHRWTPKYAVCIASLTRSPGNRACSRLTNARFVGTSRHSK